MASINISDLQPKGFDLFSDSESYMRELSEGELSIQGGGFLRDVASWFGSYVWNVVSGAAHAAGVPEEDIRRYENEVETWV